MKTALFSILILTTLLFASGCRSEEFDPKRGIYIQLDIQAEAINTNPIKTDETFTFTRNINIRDTFIKRYNIDPEKLDSFYVVAVYATFNKDNCTKLSAYQVNLTVPSIAPLSASKTANGCNFPLYLSQYPTALAVTEQSAATNATHQTIRSTNLANAIKKGDVLSLQYSLTASQEVGAGYGMLLFLATRAYYKP